MQKEAAAIREALMTEDNKSPKNIMNLSVGTGI